MVEKKKKTHGHYCTSVKVFCAVFLLLFLANGFTLQDPPYWDALTGIFSQAVWLKDNNFNYFQLWQQPKWLEGGPHINILYVLAPVYGLLIKLLGSTWAFTCIHVFNIFCAALTFTLFYTVLRVFIADKYALLWCSAAALDPIWSGQVAALYIEIPQAACYGAVLLAIHRHRYLWAAVFCLLAFLIKSSALLLALAMLVWFCVRRGYHYLLPNSEIENRGTWHDLYVILPFPVLYLMANWFNGDNFELQWSMAKTWFLMKTLLPFQTFTLMVILLALIATLIKAKWRRQVYYDGDGFDIISFLAILVVGFWMAFYLYPLPLCRYTTSMVFPMVILLSLLVSRWGARAMVLLSGLLIISGAVNQYGLLMPSIPGPKARSGEYLERSREYLLDLASNRRICRFLEGSHFNEPIVVKYPFAHMLTSADLGYVRKPFPKIYVVGRKPTFTSTRKYSYGIAQGESPLYVYAPNVFEYYTQPSLAPDHSAEIVYVDTVLDAPAVIYYYPDRRFP